MALSDPVQVAASITGAMNGNGNTAATPTNLEEMNP
jgi:hypothetical protein